MNKFVILTTQRSGSTFFWRYLNQHPELDVSGEIFLNTLNNDKSYSRYRSNSLKRKLLHIIYRKQLVNAFLTWFFSCSAAYNAAGFKIMYGQLNKQIEQWLFANNVSVIHLIRQNILKTIISLATAEKRGVYHVDEGTHIEPVKVKLDISTLLPEIKLRCEQIEFYRKKYGTLRYREVIYEDLTRDLTGETLKIFDFLGVENRTGMQVPLGKINPDALEEVVENYDEVKKALIGSGFEEYVL